MPPDLLPEVVRLDRQLDRAVTRASKSLGSQLCYIRASAPTIRSLVRRDTVAAFDELARQTAEA